MHRSMALIYYADRQSDDLMAGEINLSNVAPYGCEFRGLRQVVLKLFCPKSVLVQYLKTSSDVLSRIIVIGCELQFQTADAALR